MSTVARLSKLDVTTALLDGRPSTLIAIDGDNVLRLQRPERNWSGRLYSPDRAVFVPSNPVDLLPPDSAALLPTAFPRHAMIGICDCGTAGCGSLWLQVRRDGATVIWEPDPDAPGTSIDTTWTFDLCQYLDAIDDGQRSTQVWEGRSEHIARDLRRERDSLHGFLMVDPSTRQRVELLDASAWPGLDRVLLTAATGIRQLEFPVNDDVTDEQIVEMLHTVDLDRWT